MIESPLIDDLRTYVDALPPDDRAILAALAGLDGHPIVERDDLHEFLQLNRPKTNARVERACARLRYSLGLHEIEPIPTDEEMVEALVIGEIRRRAKKPKPVIPVYTGDGRYVPSDCPEGEAILNGDHDVAD